MSPLPGYCTFGTESTVCSRVQGEVVGDRGLFASLPITLALAIAQLVE